jgi:hypothetical protein
MSVCERAAIQRPKVCIHCLQPVEVAEADHVFPSSWYPDSTPSTVQRWTAPSCSRCNRKLGQLEKDLLVRLVGCLDPKSEAASGLHAKVLRSLGIDTGTLPETEKCHREKLKLRLQSEFIPMADIAGRPGSIPGLGPPGDSSAEWAIPIPFAGLSIMAEKIARGCEYKFNDRKRLVAAPYGVRTLIRPSDFVPEPFASACKLLNFGPGCKIRRLFFIEDHETVWYFLSIWNSLNIHVRIELEIELQKADLGFNKADGITPPDNRGLQISPYLRYLNQPTLEEI